MNDRATQLFAEYLDRLEAGAPPDVEELCARAGSSEADLRGRIRALSVLDDLGETLRAEDGAPEPAPRALDATIARLGKYERLRLLGETGLSRVYAALDPGLQREVALKVIASELVPVAAAHAWMQREGRSLARLKHPNVVDVFDLGATDDGRQTYVAMELVDGPSLAAVLDLLRARRSDARATSADPRVDTAADRVAGTGARAALALRIARALAVCHAAGVLHRDVKPGNVLVQADGEPKLIDFGLAHLGADGADAQGVTQRLIGTPAYIAPEQVESGQTGRDPRSDQFSFGVLLYELLTLATPFQRDTRTRTLDAVAAATPTPPRKLDPSIPPDLETICLHALEREPDDRYVSMQALADDLEAFLDHRAIAVSPPGARRRLELWMRRNRRDVRVVGASAIAVLAVIAILLAIPAYRSAARIRDESAALLAEVDGLAGPSAVHGALSVARELEMRADEVGRSLLGRIWAPAAAARAHEVVRAISDRMHERIEDAQRVLRKLDPYSRRDQHDELARQWQEALTLEARICPTCPANVVDRERGIVDVPPPPPGTSVRVEQRSPSSPMESAFVDLGALRSLRTGEFRVTWLDSEGRGLGEYALEITPRMQRATLVLEPLDATLRERFVRIPAGSIRIPGPDLDVPVPEFWAYSGWLSSADVAARKDRKAFSPEEDLEYEYGKLGGKMIPAQARFTARGYSARLPTLYEALRIRDVTAAGGSGLEPLPGGMDGEFCDTVKTEQGRLLLMHASAHGPWIYCIDGGIPSGRGCSFRLVLSHRPAP